MPAEVICLGGASHGKYAEYCGDFIDMPKQDSMSKPDKNDSLQIERYRLVCYKTQYAGRRYAYLLRGEHRKNYRHMFAFCTSEFDLVEDKNV